MSKSSDSRVHVARSIVLLCLFLSILVACGGPEPTAQIVVVTATQTPEPLVQVVTATFTPEPLVVTAEPSVTAEVMPTDTPRPTEPSLPPTETPMPTAQPSPTEPPALEFYTYEHPSGIFSLDIPIGAAIEEESDGVYYSHGESLFMVFYAALDAAPTTEEMESLIPVLIEDVLMDEELIISYDDLSVERSASGDVVASSFSAVSDEVGDGEGSLILWKLEQTLFMMVMLTPDYGAIEDVWETAMASIDAVPVEPPAAPLTSAPPTSTPKPKPQPTATPQQASPALPADKACLLFENSMDAEANVTFTAKDWQWSDVVFIAPGESKLYCLDPGRYAATVDVPPPWTGYNVDLELKAGEHSRWPIYGE